MTDAALSNQYPAADIGDCLELLKPRVMSLAVFTAAVGLVVAPVPVHPVIAVASVLFIALGAGAAGALNMWWDADIDAVMRRTRGRPIPAGRVSSESALVLGLWLAGISVALLALTANLLASGLLAFTILFYTVIYTIWLKRLTPENIVIGGAAGAFPPMIGWAVATGQIGVESLLMFALILLWTPPHFWSLALITNEDYRTAGVPMLPVTHGGAATRNRILGYALATAPVALLLAFTPIGGPAYLALSVGLNIRFVTAAHALRRHGLAAEPKDRQQKERDFFRLSIAYLFLLFLGLLVEAALRSAGWTVSAWPILVGG
ncbi:MAG: heme o synthase [Paracoccaceae bacterium]|nr:heme o synthase [Paracoccaceae bacterium]